MGPRISIVTLGVDDLDESVAFYRNGLGWPQEATERNIAFFETAGPTLALYPNEALAEDATVAPDGDGFRGMTLAQNVESKAAVDNALEEAQVAGGDIVKPAQETDWGGYSGYVADPDGFLWEVAWNPDFEIES